MSGPGYHGRTHVPGGTDPIPGLEDLGACCCLPASGARVVPPYKNLSTEQAQAALPPWAKFGGGVVAARLYDYFVGSVAGTGISAALAPSRICASADLQEATDYDSAPDCWQFRPVDDLGLEPGVIYGIFYSFKAESSGAPEVWVQSRSNNTAADADVWGNGGGGSTLAGPSNRHPNAGSTPYDVIDWIRDPQTVSSDPGNWPDAVNLDYFGMWPIGGDGMYGDWVLQTGGSGVDNGEWGLAFEEGEVVTVRAWIEEDSDPCELYLDHIVAIPTYPAGKSEALNIQDGHNWRSSALTAFGYEPDSEPASITNPTDNGQWLPGDTVSDSQVIPWPTDADAHLTVAGHDESDIAGLFDGGGSSVHVYVLCRGHNADGSTAGRSGGHVSCFAGAQPIGEILVDEAGGWHWAYAGRMPMGDGPQAAFGMMQWSDDCAWFFSRLDAWDEVRTAFIAYVPDAPCEVLVIEEEE